RERPSEVLNEQTEKTLRRSRDRAMEHHRRVDLPVDADVFAAEPGRLDEVGLRTVERRFSLDSSVGDVVRVERLPQRRHRLGPFLVVADELTLFTRQR